GEGRGGVGVGAAVVGGFEAGDACGMECVGDWLGREYGRSGRASCDRSIDGGRGNESVAGGGGDVAVEAGEEGGGGFFGEGAAGGKLDADDREEREGGGVVPNDIVAAGGGRGRDGDCVAERSCAR